MAIAFGDAYVRCVLPGSECKIPAGVLTVSLELYPPLTETLTADIISTQVSTLDSLHPSVYLCLCLFIMNKDLLWTSSVSLQQNSENAASNRWELLWRQHCKSNIKALDLITDATLCFALSNHWRGRGRQRKKGCSWCMLNSGGESSSKYVRHISPKWWKSLHRFVQI